VAVEDLEDHHGAVHDLAADFLLEVARLRGRDLVVDEDEVGILGDAAQLLPLAGAEVRRDVEFGPLLRERADDLEAQRFRELAQLGQRGVELDVAYAGQLYRGHDRALCHQSLSSHTSATRRLPKLKCFSLVFFTNFSA
jgi:hypothetical protein